MLKKRNKQKAQTARSTTTVANKTLELKRVIGEYLNILAKDPAFETAEKDFAAQDRLVNFLTILNVAVKLVSEDGKPLDEEYLSNLSNSERKHTFEVLNKLLQKKHSDEETAKILHSGSSKQYLFAYISRELNWVVVSILSASYISANIIMRSILELLIGIATRATGSMSKRIDSISFVSTDEKKEISKLWHELCAWSHPYQKWEKEVCPLFVLHKPMYHEKLCRQATNNLGKIVDFMLVVSLGKFGVNKQKVINALCTNQVDTTFLKFFALSP